MEFCQSRGLPVLKHHLFPRTKGFCCMLKNMKDTCEFILKVPVFGMHIVKQISSASLYLPYLEFWNQLNVE